MNKKAKSFIDIIFTDNCYCWLAAVCAAVISLIIAYCYDMIPFGDITILRMDMYHQYCPLFAELYDRVTGLESFMYSWETGLGSSFLGNFYNYLCSPSAIFVLIFGHKNVTEAIAAMIFSKSAFAAASFTYYLKKSFKKTDFSTAAFGVIYCMCGWFIAYYWDLMWIDAMVFFPITVLGIERIIDSRKPVTYIIALSFTLITNYYMGYMVCIFSIIYFLVYYFSKYGFTQSDNFDGYWIKENGKKSMSFRQRFANSLFFRSGVTFAASSIISAMLCAFALIPVYFILQNSYATNDDFPTKWNLYFTIFDFIANHLSSVEPTIRSSGDVVLPNIWCGVGTAMLVPLYLFTKSISIKEKVANIVLLAILLVSFDVNILSFIWHAFHYPSDLPYRFSFMYCFILLTIGFKTFIRIKEFTSNQILTTGIAFLAFIIIVQKIQSANVDDTSVIVSIIFIFVYTLVFYASRNKKFAQSTVAVMLLCCAIAETVCSTVPHYDIDQPKKNYAGDYDSYKKIQKQTEGKDKDLFYRTELTYNRARMAPAWYGYNGVSTFTSMAYESLSKLENYLGLAGNNVDSYTYHLQTPIYNMMHSLKYIYDNDSNVLLEDDYYTKLKTEGVFTAYKVNHYLPVAYCVYNDVEQWYYSDSDPFAVQEEWFELATGLPFAMERIELDDIGYYNINEITSGLATGDIYYDKTTTGEEGEISFYIKSDEEKHCYLYVDSSQFDDISIEVDDLVTNQSINEPYIWDLGILKANKPAKVIITLDKSDDYGSFDFDVYAMNDYCIDSGYEILKDNSIEITEFKNSKIKGKINVPEGKFIYTSIPYDKGWTVKLNGKKVNKDKIFALGDGFLCIKANPGEYDIEFRFIQPGLIEGLFVSLSAVIAILLFALFLKKRNEKQVYIDLMNGAGAVTETFDISSSDSPFETELFEDDYDYSDDNGINNAESDYSEDPEEL
ncbi:MAG: YfhO family protein [Clostridia bacterium]|nr:YfhO family protein [Clostridia bacterium]